MVASARVPKPLFVVEIIVAFAIAASFVKHAAYALTHSDGDYFIDLRPMYCAGASMHAHASPYTIEPITSCQLALGALKSLPPLPAPLPPYALEPFVPLSTLPFAVVGALYVVLAVLAFACATYWIASLARVRWPIAALAIFWTGFYSAANLGQLSVVALAAIAGTAYFVEQRRYFAAGFIATLALLQPTLAVPLLAVLAIAQPRARIGLLCGVAIVALLGLLAGPALEIAYFKAELPSHAASEIYMPFQFSATWLAAALGSSPAFALRFGSLSYIAAVLFAIAAGIIFTRRGRPALALLYAVSAVTIGGTFIHLSQLAAALPAGLVLASRARRGRTLIAAATAVLGTEWLSAWYQSAVRALEITLLKSVTESIVFVTFLRAGGVARDRALLAGATFVAASLLVAGIVMHEPLGPPTIARSAPARVASAGPLLSDRWRVWQEDTNRGRDVARITAIKAVPWLALVIIVGFGAVALADDSILDPPAAP